METINMDYLATWVGKERTDVDNISLRHATLMAATVNCPNSDFLCEGGKLPPLWHWTYFLEGQPTAQLGSDGHPSRGGFLPPVPLSNRMWAGGRVTFLAPVFIGATIQKTSRILNIEHKQGRSGDLVFVTILHELQSMEGELLISEEQDLVYKGPSPAHQAAIPASDSPASQFSRTFIPTSTMLFRYSALTFNGHRIHYDADYCRETEGYANLVVHGPLTATMLAAYAEEINGRHLRGFNYRGLAPALLGNSLTLHGNVQRDTGILFATLGNNVDCMRAEAVFKFK